MDSFSSDSADFGSHRNLQFHAESGHFTKHLGRSLDAAVPVSGYLFPRASGWDSLQPPMADGASRQQLEPDFDSHHAGKAGQGQVDDRCTSLLRLHFVDCFHLSFYRQNYTETSRRGARTVLDSDAKCRCLPRCRQRCAEYVVHDFPLLRRSHLACFCREHCRSLADRQRCLLCPPVFDADLWNGKQLDYRGIEHSRASWLLLFLYSRGTYMQHYIPKKIGCTHARLTEFS